MAIFSFKKDRQNGAEPERRSGLFQRLKQGLTRTRAGLTEGLARLVLGKKAIDDELLEEIETHLLAADVGAAATQRILADLTARVQRKQLGDAQALLAALKEDMAAILAPCSRPLAIPVQIRPYIILMVGVNGVGKTTTIGKLAKRLQGEGLSVMLAAGDTFRAAAVEQLKTWGERNGVAVIAQERTADPASVIFDGVQAARARGIDVLIADTAGRLHTQSNLMEELKKIKRVIAKLDPSAPHETLLVIDAGTGQNALNQARQFHEAVGVSGIVLTKLDGTAKGGVIFAVAEQMKLPIRFIGVGEGIDDLRPFAAGDFVDALFAAREREDE
jgi:fused signal recognition particle receptor